jgi:tetratricopeptide (TPR) repeat protein
MWQEEGAPLRAGAFLVRASVLDPDNAQNRIRLARCYVATGRFADAKNEAIKVLEQLPDNGDAIIVLTEAARSKEDIEAAEEQLRKFPKKNDVSFTASANLFGARASWPRRATQCGTRSLSIPNRPPRTWRWETCIYSRKTRNKLAKNSRKRQTLRRFDQLSA